MSSAAAAVVDAPPSLHPVPGWVASTGPGSEAEAAFRAGAALALLHPVAAGREGSGQGGGVPLALLRDRMALAAAEACIVRTGGRARAAELRDRMGFLPADARMDPETAQVAFWRRAGTTRLRGDGLARLLPDGMAEAGGSPEGRHAVRQDDGEPEIRSASGKDDGDEDRRPQDGIGDPIAQAVRVLERLPGTSSERAPAILMLADAALARALGWSVLLPLLSTGLARRDVLLQGASLRQACCAAVAREAVRALRLAADLERRAARLRAVAPGLRSKASDAAVALFLARDAVAPSMDLAPVVRGTRTPMSPRAAGRLCDRLVSLGAVRELTGRSTFRLYGL